MNIEKIILQEAENDGQTVNIYYDEMIGKYVAYGLSAFYLTMVVNPILSYSDKLGMPVAILSQRKFFDARQSMTLVEKISHEYYKLKLRKRIGNVGYEKWIQELMNDK